MDAYWAACQREVEVIKADKPTRASEVVTILSMYDPERAFLSGDAFWSPANGGDDLLPLLQAAGWEVATYHASYHWEATHPATGDRLEYIEGDVYNRTPLAPLDSLTD